MSRPQAAQDVAPNVHASRDHNKGFTLALGPRGGILRSCAGCCSRCINGLLSTIVTSLLYTGDDRCRPWYIVVGSGFVCTRVLPDGRGSLHLADSMSHVGIMSIAMPQKGNHTSTNYTVNYGRIVEVNVQELH